MSQTPNQPMPPQQPWPPQQPPQQQWANQPQAAPQQMPQQQWPQQPAPQQNQQWQQPGQPMPQGQPQQWQSQQQPRQWQPMQQPPMQQPPAQQPQGPHLHFRNDEHYSVHNSYVWLRSISTILFMAFLLLVSSGDEDILMLINSGVALTLLLVPIFLIILCGISIAISALQYKNFSFVFGERELSVYSGIISKHHVHVPYSRVQSVNHTESLLQRFAGVCTVKIDTAGGASNKAVTIPYVKLDTAEAIRLDLFMRKALQAQADEASAGASQTAGAPGQVPGVPMPNQAFHPQANVVDQVFGEVGNVRGVWGGNAIAMEPITYEYGLTNSELALTSISNSGTLAAAFVLTFTGLFTGVIFDNMLTMALAIPLAIGALITGLAAGTLAVGINYGNFKARRRGSRIEVERGLIQRTFSGIDIDKVQSITIKQSFVRRIMGYCEISVGRIMEGSADENNNNLEQQGLVVHPFVKLDRVDEVLAGLLPEFADRPQASDFRTLPAVALRRAIIRRCILFNVWLYIAIPMAIFHVVFIATASAGVSGDALALVNGLGITYYIITALATAWSAVSAVLWQKHSYSGINAKYATIHNDGLATEHVTMPRRKIQNAHTSTTPFQRRVGLTSIVAVTAAGTSSTSIEMTDVPVETGDAWLEWIKPRVKS